ncbi:MAG TPA: GDP-mannose 4,6-dehydratase [Candidatus Omnitrophota bacterium]|nr:GDP-mannose 4,6-dehydratase [Candidatus Omnitrophota bacterium]
MKVKKALITGITGQDGSHLAEFLLKKDYKVFGLIRRSSTDNTWRIRSILDKITLVPGDMTDQNSLVNALQISGPDEIYNLAAMSYVKESWNSPTATFDINAQGLTRLLNAVLATGHQASRIYQASTSEMFGRAPAPQSEGTPFYPRSMYGVSKLAAHWTAVNYRESYGLHICNGIAFNHESYRRGLEFLSRKVSYNVAKIYLGKSKELRLGNLCAKRDWGFAPEYVEAFWKMLQLDDPIDLVISTGECHTIKEFVQEAFNCVGLNWIDYVKYDESMVRPTEVDELRGNSDKAKDIIGWEPKIKFKELVRIMVATDVERLTRGDVF